MKRVLILVFLMVIISLCFGCAVIPTPQMVTPEPMPETTEPVSETTEPAPEKISMKYLFPIEDFNKITGIDYKISSTDDYSRIKTAIYWAEENSYHFRCYTPRALELENIDSIEELKHLWKGYSYTKIDGIGDKAYYGVNNEDGTVLIEYNNILLISYYDYIMLILNKNSEGVTDCRKQMEEIGKIAVERLENFIKDNG